MIAETTRRALKETGIRGNIISSTATGGCSFNATPSGDAGRCTVHLELHSRKASRCVLEEDIHDEEHSTKATTTVVPHDSRQNN